jgi:hypothetical protein
MKAKIISVVYKNGYTNWMFAFDVILAHAILLGILFAISAIF